MLVDICFIYPNSLQSFSSGYIIVTMTVLFIYLFAGTIYWLPTMHMEYVTVQLPVQIQTVKTEWGGPWIPIRRSVLKFHP